ncbi:DUF2165 family protein [Vibrio sp. Of7-15]|uniref:DUF2165 family protein n=1 Tax=Vibrio sp. Of7-15 TaxID=2724879 RepID=UPI001EF255A7|nr:DUF2165 family protein [Vibrio sp. Of7-15]MCG7500102.1 DUF2165 family protein [Vibrio sp. Of7-15]
MFNLTGLDIIKVTIISGIAVWCFIESWGVIKDYLGAKRLVSKVMNMELIQEPPMVPTKLLHRRVSNEILHHISTVTLIFFNATASLILFLALYNFVFGDVSISLKRLEFIELANYGLSVFITMGFLLSSGGVWFAYYIKHFELMITHFLLIILGISSSIIINFPTVY